MQMLPGLGHLLHSIGSENIELPGVQRLIDLLSAVRGHLVVVTVRILL